MGLRDPKKKEKPEKVPEKPGKRYESAKVILLGAQGVGKTTILAQKSGTYLIDRIQPTIGMAYQEVVVNVREVPVKTGSTEKLKPIDVDLKLMCYDTAGQERFKSIVNTYYRDVAAAIIVFDVTRADSFKDMKIWTEELKKRSKEPVVYFLVGNKVDLSTYRRIDRWTAQYFASSIGGQYFETSAFRNTGIQDLFEAIATEIVAQGLGRSPTDKPADQGSSRNCCKTS